MWVNRLILVNVGIFLLQAVNGVQFMQAFMLFPIRPGQDNFFIWQLLTYGFLHADPAHLFFNMFGLWMFGRPLEALWGRHPFLFFYLVCVVGAGLVQLALGGLGLVMAPTLGASGGVFGVLMGFGMMYPENRVMLIFPPIPMKAKYFVIIFGAFTLAMAVTGRGGNVAHFAHLGGMLFGLLVIYYWRGKLPIRPRRILKR